jgi:CDP-glucose 4,6-dehydratase
VADTAGAVCANAESGEAFRETDPLGGKDPYSASKAATEMVAAAYAESRFRPREVPLATARGGNVIGGGDFAEDRIVPDIVRAAQAGVAPVLRHPEAVRPWQHVIDCVGGYLVYAEALARGETVPAALNFGPEPGPSITVAALAEAVQSALGRAPHWRHEPVAGSVEARMLRLDSSLARKTLGWRDIHPGDAAATATARWYRDWLAGANMRGATLVEIDLAMAAMAS